MSATAERGALSERGTSAQPAARPPDAPAPGPSLSIVLPIRDEAENLPELLEALDGLAREEAAAGGALEAIAVDDGSADGSFERLADARGRYHWLRVLQLRRGYGKSAALAAGFARARGEIVATADADLQDDLAALPRLVAEVRSGRADLAVGRRSERRDPLSKRLPSAVFNWLVRRLGGVDFRDVNSGLKAMRREVALACDLYGERHRLIPLVAALDGARVVEIPVGHHPRRHGRSKYGSGRFLRGLLDLLTVTFLASYDLSPAHFFGRAGLVSGTAGGAILLYLTWLKLTEGHVQHRYPLLAAGVLLVAVGLQLVTTGVLAVLIVTRSRPPRDRWAVRRFLE